MICKHIFLITFLNEFELFFFKNELELIWLHSCIAIVFTPLNGFNYSYLTLIILFNINHLFAYIEVIPNIAIYH